MAYQMIQHSVTDYAKWKSVFDEHSAIRKARGSKGAQVLRDAENQNDLTILMEWDSVKNAQDFSASDTLHEAMKDAGVTTKPVILYFNGSQTTSA